MSLEDKVATLESEITALHNELEKRGINARGTTDIFGRPFNLPVNAEHKATVFNTMTLFSAAQPHMRVFWAATFGFFTTFFSVFAPAALGPYLKKPKSDGGLDLSKETLSLAGNLAVSGTVVMRVLAGPMCDLWGARKTFVFLLLIAMPGMIILISAQGGASFVLGRFIIGLSLATFVTCQVWCSQFFERRIVGTVNATAGGWGNVGGGVTLLVMPQIMEAFLSSVSGSKSPGDAVDWSWRMCIIIPMVLHLVAAAFVMTGRDLADGSYAELETSGAKQKSGGAGAGGLMLAKVGFSNTNALIMMMTYGLCFGVELTMNNKLTLFFNRYYAKPPRTASTLGASFSLMNLFARSWGGLLSDAVAIKSGIRGRIAAMWIIQSAEAVMCIILGVITLNKLSPDDDMFKGKGKVQGVYVDSSGLDPITYVVNGTIGAVKRCGSNFIVAPMWVTCPDNPLAACRMPVKGRVMISDANNYDPTGEIWTPASSSDPKQCIHNGNTLGLTMILIIFFSIFVQMAEGLHFGIVPYISRPALGVVSGMVGAGGNIGAVISGQFIVGSGKDKPLDRGFVLLGLIIMGLSMSMQCIFFPGQGGILLPKSFPYDPQWIKPPANAMGSDQLNFDNVKTEQKMPSKEEKLAAKGVSSA